MAAENERSTWSTLSPITLSYVNWDFFFFLIAITAADGCRVRSFALIDSKSWNGVSGVQQKKMYGGLLVKKENNEEIAPSPENERESLWIWTGHIVWLEKDTLFRFFVCSRKGCYLNGGLLVAIITFKQWVFSLLSSSWNVLFNFLPIALAKFWNGCPSSIQSSNRIMEPEL